MNISKAVSDLNILVLNYEYPPIGGGGAKVCEELCHELAGQGHHIDVVTMLYDNLPRIEDDQGIKIHRVKCLRKSDRVCHPWEQMTYCVNAYRYILKNIDLPHTDLIHCHFIIPTGLLGMWLKKKTGKKLVLTAHGSDVLGHNKARFGFAYKLIRPLWIRILRTADAVTAPSLYLVNKIKENDPDCDCNLIPNGIHLSEYIPAEKKKSIITLCRLQKSKGIQALLRACKCLDLENWEINILGDGPYRSELEKIVNEERLNDHIYFRGHTVGIEKMKFLSEAAIFFSGSEFEAFPISVLEGTLTGCNVIASDIEPHKMLVGDEHVYSSEEELIRKLKGAMNGELKAYKYDNDKYDWRNVCKDFVNLFQRCLN